MSKSKIALNLKEVGYSFGDKFALNDINLSINAGQFTVLLGPNGAGKTTLISLITRMFKNSSGKIEVYGSDLHRFPYQALAQIGVVFQQPTLDLDLSVKQNLLYHAALHGIGKACALSRIDEELNRLNMRDRIDEKIRWLNGGHRRRVEIARALIHRPKILLLDEPTVGLDVPTRRHIVEHVHSLVERENLAVIWATHLIDEVYIEDSVTILHEGRICADGLSSAVIATSETKSIAEAYDKLTGRKLT